MYVRKALNINSNAASAIVDSLFRVGRDGLMLHGSGRCMASGAAGLTGKQTALYAFGSLSWCFGVLCADRSIGLRGSVAPQTSLLCLVHLQQ